MGWNLRRSVNLGPLRINLSKAGVGYSVGARGLRVGKDARGRAYSSLSIPGTGIYRRDYLSSAPPPPAAPPSVPRPLVGQSSSKPQGGMAGAKTLALCVAGAILVYALIRVIT